jgi:hypothetical protein
MTSEYRRAYVRIPFECSADVSSDKTRGIAAILTDLSPRGAGFVSNIPFDVKDNVEIGINSGILSKDVLRKKAKIAWCKKLSPDLWNCGLDFGVDNLLVFS